MQLLNLLFVVKHHTPRHFSNFAGAVLCFLGILPQFGDIVKLPAYCGKQRHLGRHSGETPIRVIQRTIEQITIENVHLLCKDLFANPCLKVVAGELGSPLSKHLKAQLH